MTKKELPFKDLEDKISLNILAKGTFYRGEKTNKERAEIICCDKCGECSLYQRGTCLRVSSKLRSGFCKHGKTTIVEGYGNYSEASRQWRTYLESDEKYSKLHTVPDIIVLGKVGDYFYLNTHFIGFKDDESIPVFETATEIRAKLFLPQNAGIEFWYKILSAVPMIGNSAVSSYRDAIVPKILKELKIQDPYLYTELEKMYPELF